MAFTSYLDRQAVFPECPFSRTCLEGDFTSVKEFDGGLLSGLGIWEFTHQHGSRRSPQTWAFGA